MYRSAVFENVSLYYKTIVLAYPIINLIYSIICKYCLCGTVIPCTRSLSIVEIAIMGITSKGIRHLNNSKEYRILQRKQHKINKRKVQKRHNYSALMLSGVATPHTYQS